MSREEPVPRGRSRARVWIAVAAAVVVVAYVAVAVSFSRGFEQSFAPATPPDDGVGIALVQTAVHADARTLDVTVLLYPGASLRDASGRLTRTVRIEVEPTISRVSVEFPQGRLPVPATVTVPVVGEVQRYPFDSYTVALGVQAVVGTERPAALPVEVTVSGSIPGWTVSGVRTTAVTSTSAEVGGDVKRSGSTESVALLLVAMMLAMAVIAVIVVWSVINGRLDVELAVASWLMAMLFALLPVRTFMPGNPPIGSWIDILVFFWVELTLMLCVIVVAVALVRHRAREEQELPGA